MRILEPKEIRERILTLRKDGFPKGINPGWSNLNDYYRICKRQLTIVTGIPSHGKSEFVDALMINLAESRKWRFLIYSPENYPFEVHWRKQAEKLMGKKFFGGDATDWDIEQAINTISTNFYFLDSEEEDLTMQQIFTVASKIKSLDGVLIDPWNELEGHKAIHESETDYIGRCLKNARKWARYHNMLVIIVAHPTKATPENGIYPVPDAYKIHGSSHWYNKADNILCVYRNATETEIHIQKVKFKYYGQRGMVKMFYNMDSGRYEEIDFDQQNQQDFTNTLARTGERL